MERSDSNKRLKSASGAPISTTSGGGAASLPIYRPPPQVTSRSPGASASVARPANGRGPLKLTVKAAPSKLRQITSGSQSASIPPSPYGDAQSDSDVTPAPAPRTARSTRNPRTVVEPDSDDVEDDFEDAEEDFQESEGEGEVDDELLALAKDDSEEDAEGEDEDEDMDDHPPPPILKQERVPGKSKLNVTVTAPSEGPLKSVEDKEMEGSDEEELSELDSEGEGEVDGEDEDEDDDSDDDDEANSRSATPDLTKLTKRQRGQFEEFGDGLMSLSNEAQKKKHLTAEEHAMRRQEMARRRKNLSEKRNEEEKQDTINKLLKKPAPKRRTRAEMLAAHQADMTPGLEEGEEEKPDALYVRWVNNSKGSRIGVPTEWLDAPIGEALRKSTGRGLLVEEVA